MKIVDRGADRDFLLRGVDPDGSSFRGVFCDILSNKVVFEQNKVYKKVENSKSLLKNKEI